MTTWIQTDAPVYTIAQMRAWEDAKSAAGCSYAQLMENAGSRAAADLHARLAAALPVWIACGQGNNGGDGLVMARHLAAAGHPVTVCLLLGDGHLSPLSQAQLAALPPAVRRISADAWQGLPENAAVVDAVFGTGYHGDLPPAVAGLWRTLCRHAGLKVALDMPSGINGDSGRCAADCFRADLTYAFQALKPAHRLPDSAAYCGEVCCVRLV